MQDDVLGRNNVQRERERRYDLSCTHRAEPLEHPAKKVRCKFASKAMELLVGTPLEKFLITTSQRDEFGASFLIGKPIADNILDPEFSFLFSKRYR